MSTGMHYLCFESSSAVGYAPLVCVYSEISFAVASLDTREDVEQMIMSKKPLAVKFDDYNWTYAFPLFAKAV
jgi:hypothetical protein